MFRRTLRTKSRARSNRKLDSSGLSAPPSTPAVAADTTSKEVVKMLMMGNALAEQLICPITNQLPVEPVMAEDGRVYERNAIEMYIKSRTEDDPYSFDCSSGSLGSITIDSKEEILSPFTKKLMGKNLTPAKQHENTIEILVEKCAITGDLAKTWKIQQAAKKRAMGALRNLMFGSYVSQQDEKFAREWYSRDLVGVNVPGVAALGAIILHASCDSLDTEEQQQNLIEGMSYVLWAKKRGSILSAYVLGMGYAEGKYGLKPNTNKACYYLEKVVNPPEDYSNPLDIPDGYTSQYLPTAQDKLKELKQQQDGKRRTVQFLLPGH